MIFRCKVCAQPIAREAAVKTAAGEFTDGYCQRHAVDVPDVSSGALDNMVLAEHPGREEEADAEEAQSDADRITEGIEDGTARGSSVS